jgi:hypothetical protein
MAKEPILTNDKKSLRLFDNGIKMDETLPKHKEWKEFTEKQKLIKQAKKAGINNIPDIDSTELQSLIEQVERLENNINTLPPIVMQGSSGADDSILPKSGIPDYERLKEMFLKDTTLDSCKIIVTDYMKKIMEQNRFSISFSGNSVIVPTTEAIKSQNIWFRLKMKLGLINSSEEYVKELEEPETFDVISFFNRVKLSVEQEQTYVNRLKEIVECMGYCDVTGQVGLKEKLFAELITNKYESVLFANGMYKAVSADKIVELAQGSKKALSLDYIQNYGRVIPTDVIKKKIEADKLHVFDNYVILHYDPDGKSYVATEKERKKEVERKKDPILFGVIMGSDKLYYIADWIDEYCDLTFDKLTEILGKEIIEKDFIKDKISVK